MACTSPVFNEASTPSQVRDQVFDHGFCKVRAVFDNEEVAQLRGALEALVGSPPTNPGISWLSPASGGGLVVQRISRANLYNSIIEERIARAPQLLAIGSWIFGCADNKIAVATGLEGSDGVVAVIKDTRNLSEHAALRWHRDDAFTNHLAINPFVNCGVYLDDSDVRTGALLLVPRGRPFPKKSIETFDEVSEQVRVDAQAGDVVVHAADVWHRSGKSTRPNGVRRVLYGNVFQVHR